MNEDNRFESRVLADLIDVLAVINHLEDNLDGDKPLKVVLTIEPRKITEESQCSVEKPRVKIILVKNAEGIKEISKLLIEKLFTANIHVAIKQKKALAKMPET